jgi:hypothetical protein
MTDATTLILLVEIGKMNILDSADVLRVSES